MATERQRSPQRHGLVALEITASALAGGVAGLLILVAVDPRGQIADRDVLTFCAGALLGVGVDRFLRS